MRLTLFLAVLIAALVTMYMTGCGGGADPADELSNVNGMRSMVYLSPKAEYPRICFAKKVSGEYQTDISNKLPFAHTATDPVSNWSAWPSATEGFWWIIVYNDKNRDSLYQVNEFLGIANVCVRKDLYRGKFEIIDKATMAVTNWDAQKFQGNITWITTLWDE